MYLLAHELPDNTLLQGFDICIVGAGAAGIAMAKRLVGTSAKVLLLTNGQPGDRGLPTDTQQSLYRGTIGAFLEKVDPIFLERSRLNMYGGTTNHFGFWARPLDEADMIPRPGYRDAHWTIDLDELAPYYQDAHHFGHFGPYNYDDIDWWEQVMFARNFPNAGDDTLTGAIMHAQYVEELHDFQVQFGKELMNAENITVLFNAQLLEIQTTENKAHVTELHCATLEDGKRGRDIRVQANQYAMAVGGIEVVRLLKISGDLGNNQQDQLGRGFMVHPLVTNTAHVKFAEPVPVEIRNFYRDQQIRLLPPENEGGAYQHMYVPVVNPEMVFDYDMFNAWGVLVPTHQTLLDEKIGNFRLILRFDPSGKNAEVNINWEQVPNEDSRITINEDQRDPIFGQPVTHLDWRMLDVDKKTCVRAMELCEAYLRKHGATDFELIPDLRGGAEDWSFAPHEGALETGDHHMGALRMSDDPNSGIVNSNSRLHSVDNLYIAGCGIFPASGFANPTLTIVALSLRLADHMKSVVS